MHIAVIAEPKIGYKCPGHLSILKFGLIGSKLNANQQLSSRLHLERPSPPQFGQYLLKGESLKYAAKGFCQ